MLLDRETMESPSPLSCPNTVTVRRNPPRKARPTTLATAKNRDPLPTKSKDIPSFPIDDILSIKVPQTLKKPSSEGLKVYVRVRPQKHDSKVIPSRSKNVWPRIPAKKQQTTVTEKAKKNKTDEDYITINDDLHSVTLTPPLSLQESKRAKSETYKGFTHVFAAISSQAEVYDTMVKPLVDDFLGGKSGMLAALGPTGSGKTHTVFGSVRDPGMVPLALRQIFTKTSEFGQEPSRSFYISVFEICTERGKGERLLDLSEDGGDICLQQSTIKGLKEVAVRDTAQAESIIACAMLKRTTAMTNSNSQSSRSQCIINIRSVSSRLDREVNVEDDFPVLTIVDLAGAEREKRTGNQGTRLFESNFINNTSMVLGLCLRSLLEHQKNPKKPLQKHFQNSLLTRYLRDYLEGRNKMALVLTVKSGEKDYLDTSYLLRQASPYMQIKFENVEEPSNNLPNKRHFQTQFRNEQPKKIKLSRLDLSKIEHGKNSSVEQQLPKEEVSRICKEDVKDSTLSKLESVKMAKKDRSKEITQNFAKASWTVLKDYNEKLKVAEGEIQILTQSLNNEKKRALKLEKELEDVKSCCVCSEERTVQAMAVKLGNHWESTSFDKTNVDTPSCQPSDQTNVHIHSPDLKPFQRKITSDNSGSSPKQTSIEPQASSEFKIELKEQENTTFEEADFDTHPTNCQPSECSTPSQKYDSFSSQDEDILHSIKNKDIHSPNPISTPSMSTLDKFSIHRVEKLIKADMDLISGFELEQETTNSYKESLDLKLSPKEIKSMKSHHPRSGMKPETFDKTSNLETPKISSPPLNEPGKETMDQNLSLNGFASTTDHDNAVPNSEMKPETSDKSLNMENAKPNSPPVMISNDSCHSERLVLELDEVSSEAAKGHNSAGPNSEMQPETFGKPLNTDKPKRCSPVQELNKVEKGSMDQNVFLKKATITKGPDNAVSNVELKQTLDNNPNPVKPKRRLMPAATILVKDISALDVDDPPEKPRGNRGGGKMSQGSISLIRLLKTNYRHK